MRGVIRSNSSIPDLKSKSAVVAHAHDINQLEFAVVPDFLKPGVIQEVLGGVTTIVHLASPLAIQVATPIYPGQTIDC